MLPMSEAHSAVWTAEMSQAFGVVIGMIDAGEIVAARMAFKETYLRLVTEARDAGIPVEWHVTLGHDVRGRESVLTAAVDAGRLTYEHAKQFIPELPMKAAPKVETLAFSDALQIGVTA